MPQSLEDKVQIQLVTVQYVGTASTDVTTNIIRRINELTGDVTARLKAIFVAAGTSN